MADESYAGAFLAVDEGGAGHYASNLSDSDVFCHSITKPEKSSLYGIFCVICFVQSTNIALLENRSKTPSAPRHIRVLRGSPRFPRDFLVSRRTDFTPSLTRRFLARGLACGHLVSIT